MSKDKKGKEADFVRLRDIWPEAANMVEESALAFLLGCYEA